METYTRNLKEFDVQFGSDEACREYLLRLRWPNGFRCPRCGCRESSPVRTVLLRCRDCRHQTSVTAGTIFQDTRSSLRLWFQAMWWVTSQKNGVSALGLQRVLGLNSYETAWTWLHKLRHAMVRPGRDLLTGRIEVDECYLGGMEEGLPGRLNLKKALIVVAAQEDGPGIGRIRMRQILDASAESLVPFVQDSVAPGSVIHTDGWLGYLPLERQGYQHDVTFLKGRKKTPAELMPRVHLVISLSNGGWWEPTRGRSAISISTTTWTSLPSDSIGGDQEAAASSSSDSCSKLWQSSPFPWIGSFTPELRSNRNHNL